MVHTGHNEEEHEVDISDTLYGRECKLLHVLVDRSCMCMLTSVLQVS